MMSATLFNSNNASAMKTYRKRSRGQFPEIDIAIGKNLQKIRQYRDVSQTQIANHLNVSFQQIQKYEKGVNRLSGSSMFILSKYLDVDVRRFYDGLNSSEEEQFKLYSSENIKFLRLIDGLPNKKTKENIINIIKALSGATE